MEKMLEALRLLKHEREEEKEECKGEHKS